MIRQARNYLVSAVSGATLIGAAIAVFVVLVSAQVFHDWPIAALGDGGPKPAVSAEQALPGGSGSATATADVGRAATGNARGDAAANGGSHRPGGSGVSNSQTTPVSPEAAEPAPSSGNGPPSGDEGSSPANPPAASPPGNGGGSGAGGGAEASEGGGGGSESGGSGGGKEAGATPEAGGSGGQTSASAGVTETVNGVVNGVDEATGGVVGSTGATEVTEGVVNGVAGPESTVGKVVDGSVESVNGLLGGGK